MAGLSPRAFCIGLTGGIGSGKTAVSDLFARHGASIVDTDVLARGLTKAGGQALPAIFECFGPAIRSSDGTLDRAALRARVFSDPDAKMKLEAILHPMIRLEAQRLCEQAAGPYVIVVVPLLAEHSEAYGPWLDRIAVVDCDEELQIKRASLRPGLDETQVRAILASQADSNVRRRLADDVIENRGDMASLAATVMRLHQKYLKLAASKASRLANNSLR